MCVEKGNNARKIKVEKRATYNYFDLVLYEKRRY